MSATLGKCIKFSVKCSSNESFMANHKLDDHIKPKNGIQSEVGNVSQQYFAHIMTLQTGSERYPETLHNLNSTKPSSHKGNYTFLSECTTVQSKNAVCAFIKHNRYFNCVYNFTSIHSHAKRLYFHIFDVVDTAFSYEKELIVCSFLEDFFQGKRK